MGITAQRRELRHLRKILLEIGEEAPNGNSVALYSAGSQGSRQSLNMSFENLTDEGMGQWRVRVVAGETELSLERRTGRKILRQDQPGADERVLGGQHVEQAAEPGQVYAASAIGQGWVFLAKTTKPAEKMGVAAQLSDLAQLWEILLEKGEEAMDGSSEIS